MVRLERPTLPLLSVTVTLMVYVPRLGNVMVTGSPLAVWPLLVRQFTDATVHLGSTLGLASKR